MLASDLLYGTAADPMYDTAAHEAGHAVAHILAFRALGQDWPSFDRVLIRRDASKPYVARKGI